MPFPLDVTKEDFTSFRYNRKVHLLILVIMGSISVVVNLLTYFTNDQTRQFWGLFLLLIYLLCWWLRGHEKCASLFPAFHYITLMIEYVFHCLTVLASMIFLLMMLVVLSESESFELLIIILVIIMIAFLAFYGYIVFKLTPFVITVVRGSPADKEEVGREIRGMSAGVPPGGPSGGVMAQPLPVQVQTG